MNNKIPKLNETKLTSEQRDKLDKWKHDAKQLQTLEDIASMTQELVGIMDDQKKDEGRKTLIIDHVTGEDFTKILTNMNEALNVVKGEQPASQPLQPVVDALSRLEKAFRNVKTPDIKAPAVNVEAPKVSVGAPDLSQIEKVLKTDLPKAFDKSIANIPKPEKPDNSEMLKTWKEISDQLENLDKAMRLKPLPGSIKINNTSSNPVPISGTVTVSGGGGTVNQSSTIDVAPATQNITARDVSSVTTTGANGQPSTIGPPTAGSVASFAVAGYDSARIQVTGIWTGTLVAQVSLDGVIWYNQGIHQSGTAYNASTFTANFAGTTNAAGVTNWRLQATTAWTGTATVKVIASVNPSSVYVQNNLALRDSTVQSIANTIKPASTAPVAGDTALVVSMSPNSISTSLNAELGDFTGTITNATQTTPVVASGLAGYDNVFISINGTYTGATAIFEGSDDGGTTWFATRVAARVDTPIIEGGYTLLTNISRGWNLNIQGFDSVRVNPSAVATGTVNVRISAESAPTNAGATVQSLITDGTNTANILKSDGTAAGQNSQLVAGSYQPIALSLGPTPTSGQFLLASTDVSNYKHMSIQFTGTWTGTYVLEVSNDNTNWVTGYWSGIADNGNLGGVTSNQMAVAPLVFRYIRIRCSVTGTGTTTGVLQLYASAMSRTLSQPLVSQLSSPWVVNTASATGSTVPANAFYQGMSNSSSNLVGLRSGGSGGFAMTADNTLAIKPFFANLTNTDQAINNITAALIAAGTTSTQTGITMVTYNGRGLTLVVNIASGAGTVTVAINGTTASGYSTNQLTSAALVAGTTTLRIFDGATPTANSVSNDKPFRNISVTATVVGTVAFGIDYVLTV